MKKFRNASLTALLVFAVGCEVSPNAPSPLMANVAGTWVLQSPTGTSQTSIVLEQDGSIVEGRWFTSDLGGADGIVLGSVSRDQFTIRAEILARRGDAASCSGTITVVTGVLAASGDSLSGEMTSVRQPPCILRPFTGSYIWRKPAATR